jgi:hypothetical protein
MALSAEEQAELNALEAELVAPVVSEQEELAQLELEASGQPVIAEEKPHTESQEPIEASFLQAAPAIASSIVSQPLSGLIGLAVAPFVGAEQAAEIIGKVQKTAQDLTAPDSPEGQEALRQLGEFAGKGEDIVRGLVAPPIAAATVFAQADDSEDFAAEKVKRLSDRIKEEGVGKTLGDITFESIDDPQLASIAGGIVTGLPEATVSLLGLKGGGAAIRSPLAIDASAKVTTGVNETLKRLLNEPEINFVDDAGKITDEGLGKIQQIEDAGGDLSKLDAELGRQLQSGDVLTPEQAGRFNLFAERGVQPVRSQITQAGEDFIISQELAKGSNKVSDVLASQDLRLEQLAREGQENIGGVTASLPETNANLFQTVDNIVATAEGQVNAAYKAAREIASEDKVIRLDGLMDEVRANAGRESQTKGVISSLLTDLENKGIIKKGEFDAQGRIDVETAESVRQELNALSNDTTGRGRKLIRDFKDKLDQDVADAVGNDVFAGAREARVELDRLIRRQRRDIRDKTKTTLLEDIISNKVPQEKIVDKIRTARDDDFLKMKQFFLEDSGPQGIQAWNNFKSQVFSDAVDKAIGTRAKTEGGGRGFKGNIFAKQFEGLRKTEKFNELFNADEIKLIDDIAEIDFLRNPKTGTISGKGPSSIAVQELKDAEKGTIVQKVLQLTPVLGTSSASRALKNRAIKKAERNIENANQRDIERQIDITTETEEAAKRLKKVGS